MFSPFLTLHWALQGSCGRIRDVARGVTCTCKRICDVARVVTSSCNRIRDVALGVMWDLIVAKSPVDDVVL